MTLPGHPKTGEELVTLTQHMLEAAQAQAWDNLESLRVTQDAWIRSGQVAWSEKTLQQVLDLNAQVATCIQQARDASGDRFTQSRERVQAIQAYRA